MSSFGDHCNIFYFPGVWLSLRAGDFIINVRLRDCQKIRKSRHQLREDVTLHSGVWLLVPSNPRGYLKVLQYRQAALPSTLWEVFFSQATKLTTNLIEITSELFSRFQVGGTLRADRLNIEHFRFLSASVRSHILEKIPVSFFS